MFLALSLVCKPVVLTEQSSIALKSSHLSVILKEESPSTKIFKANASRKLNKGRTFLDEDEDIKLENKVLKFKYDRQSKEVQDLKYQLKVNQEVSASFRNTIIEETNKRDLEEPYTMDRAMNELLNSSYYAAFLQKLKQDMNTENNFMALIQNQGVLLRTRNIEISFRNVLEKAETGGFWLKYQLNVKNLEARMLENLWVVYKQPGKINKQIYFIKGGFFSEGNFFSGEMVDGARWDRVVHKGVQGQALGGGGWRMKAKD